MEVDCLGSKHQTKSKAKDRCIQKNTYRLQTLLIFHTLGATPGSWSSPIDCSKSKTLTTEKMSFLGHTRRALGRLFPGKWCLQNSKLALLFSGQIMLLLERLFFFFFLALVVRQELTKLTALKNVFGVCLFFFPENL